MAKNRYEKLKHLGEGQFANVYKAKDTQEDVMVAIKKIKLGHRSEAKDGVNRTALREIKLLQEIHHPNIITLRDVIGGKSNIQLVFDFMDTDLEHVINDRHITISVAHAKNLILQTLTGVAYLHSLWILHRDLKPNNLLLNAQGTLKVTDFGLARVFGSPNRIYTHQVVTRWYRCPELLMGARNYGVGVDVWSIGCIFAELLLRVPLFQGDSDIDQLVKIFDMLGTPTEEYWPKMSCLPDYMILKPSSGRPLKEYFMAVGDDALDLLTHCLCFDPLHRANCALAMQLPFFANEPYATVDEDLPLPGQSLRKIPNSKRRIDQLDSTGEEPTLRKRLAF